MRFPTQLTPTATDRSALSLFDKFFSEFFADREVRSGTHAPPVNIAETDRALHVELELPGVEEKNIDVEIHGNQLIVKATREFHEENAEWHAVEHRYGSIARRIMLPRGLDSEAVTATFENGILKIEVPKAEPIEARKIEIKTK